MIRGDGEGALARERPARSPRPPSESDARDEADAGAAVGSDASAEASDRSRDLLERAARRPVPFAPPRIAGYELEELLGSGGMGVVFRARQLEPRREVAVKVLRGEMTSPRALARFRREIEVLARIRHRSIVRILDAGVTEEGYPYHTMELVVGTPWREAVASPTLSLRDRLALFLQVCEGVAHLHKEGVLHRDIKPGNLRVDAHGRVRILDFGLARAASASAVEVTRPGEPLGTSQYMSPEQWRDAHAVDGRTDVYSLGVVLYELLGGTLDEEIVSSQDIWEEERSLRLRAREELAVDRDLRAIVECALEVDPEARTPDPEALALDLRRYLTALPVLARRTPPLRRARLFLRRHAEPLRRLAIAGSILVLGALASAGDWIYSARLRDRTEAKVESTLEACDFILHELEGGAAAGMLRREEVTETLDEVLAVLATIRAEQEGASPALPLIERAEALRGGR